MVSQNKNWEVTCRLDTARSVYAVSAARYYEAQIKGLRLFLEEYKIPGKPWEYLTTKKGVIEVSVALLKERKDGTRKALDVSFYYGQIDTLRRLIRTGDFRPDVKKKAGLLLLKLKDVLSG